MPARRRTSALWVVHNYPPKRANFQLLTGVGMPLARITMRKIKDVLRLKLDGMRPVSTV